MKRSASTILWLAGLYLAFAAVTVAAYFTLIIPDYRGATFHQVLVSSCVAELVLFVSLSVLVASGATRTTPGHAMRLRIMVVVTIWALAVIISGAMAVVPKWADTFYADKILLFQLIGTVLFLAAAYLLYHQDVVVSDQDEGPQLERVRIRSYAMGLDPLLAGLKSLGDRVPSAAVEVDRLSKRLDTLKSQLLSSFPATARDPGRQVRPASTERIVQCLQDVHVQVKALADADEAGLEAQMARTRESIDGAIAALRHREDALTL